MYKELSFIYFLDGLVFYFINKFIFICKFLFNKNFIYFNWRLIILQYCSGFCHTLTWISHGCAWVPHPEPPSRLPPHPIPQCCTSFGCPVSRIELGLVIYFYGNIHVSMLFSQIIPPLPSPTASKVCSLYLCLFCCLTYRVIVTIFLKSTYMH